MAHDEALARLEDGVAQWGADVAEAQQGLSERLAGIRGRLDTVAAGQAARTVERAALADAETTVETLKEAVARREQDLRDASERADRLERQAGELATEVDAVRTRLGEQEAVAAASAAEAEERLTESRAEAEAVARGLAQREEALQNAGERIAELEARKNEMAEELAGLRAQAEELAAQAVAAEEVEEVQGRLARAESDKEALTQLVEQHEQEALDSARRIAQLEGQVATLSDNLADFQAQLEQGAEDEETRNAELAALRAALAEARERLAKAEAQAADDSEGPLAEGAEAQTLRAELAEAGEQILELRRQLAAHPPLGQIEELQRLLQQERERADRLEEQRAQPRQDAVDHAALAEQLATALRDRDEAHQEIVSLRAEVDMLRRANAALTTPAAPAAHEAEPLAIERLGEDGHKRRMGEILVEIGVISPQQLQDALDEQAVTPQRRLGAILIEREYTSEEVVARVLARQLDLPFVRLTEEAVDDAAPRIITAQLAKRRMCVPIAVTPDRIVLAMANPFDLVAVEDVERTIDRRVDPVVTTPSDIASALLRHYQAG